MSERQKQIQFLKTVIGHNDSGECHNLRERISRAEREERFLRRILLLVFVLILLSLAGLGYARVFWLDPFHPRFQLLVKFASSVGLASVICLVVFTGYWLWHRAVLNGLYKQCRELFMATIKDRSEN